MFPATPSNTDQLKKIQVPLILMIALGVVRIVVNYFDLAWYSLSWHPLRILQALVFDFGINRHVIDSERPFEVLGSYWWISDIPSRLFAVVAILVLVKVISPKTSRVAFAPLIGVSVLISIMRLFQIISENLSWSPFTTGELVRYSLGTATFSWLPYALLAAWVYFASQSTPTINPILMQTLQPNPTPQEGHLPVEPPFNQPPQGAQTGPQGFGDTRAAGGYSIYDKPQFRLQMFGAGDRLFTLMELRALADAKSLQPSTLVLQDGVGFAMPASTIPGVFSKKTWLVALLLALFVGTLGIDRFYLGHTGIGIAKLLTFGGCGVWALIDLVLIAMRKVKDSEGLQLS